MGVTPLMWKAMENFANFYNFAIWTCPTEWNPVRKQMVYNKSSKSLIPWAIVLFGLTTVVFGVCITLLLLHIFGTVNLELLHGIVAGFIMVLIIFAYGMEIMFLYGENLVYACNCAVLLCTNMSKF
jgi:hypothetical protein